MKLDFDLFCVVLDDRSLPTRAEVAKAYNGEDMVYTRFKRMRSIIPMSQTAVRLEIFDIVVLRKIMNNRHLEVVLRKKQLEIFEIEWADAKSEYGVSENFFLFQSLRVCFAFFVWKEPPNAIHAPFWLRDLSKRNDYRPVWRGVSRQYMLFISAYNESSKSSWGLTG